MICDKCFMTDKDCPICQGSGVILDSPKATISPTRLAAFGSEEQPIHASMLPELINCNWKVAVAFLVETVRESNEAADTGSAMHIAVAEWHREGKVDAAIEAMRSKLDRYKKANLDEAAKLFRLYSRDPRNKEASFAEYQGQKLIEKQIEFVLQPAKNDPTQAPIHIVGTLDQVRLDPLGKPRVWDLKTSKRPGWDLMNMYLYQLAAYSLGASKLLSTPVNLGGLITPRHYKGDPESLPLGVFWNYPHKFDDLASIIQGVRLAVAQIRAGEFHISPGSHCHYCPLETTNDCISVLQSVSVVPD